MLAVAVRVSHVVIAYSVSLLSKRGRALAWCRYRSAAPWERRGEDGLKLATSLAPVGISGFLEEPLADPPHAFERIAACGALHPEPAAAVTDEDARGNLYRPTL